MHLIRIDSYSGHIGRFAWCNSDTRFPNLYGWIGNCFVTGSWWGSTYQCLYGNDKPITIRRPPCT
jgi:hypothetical protein